MKREFLKELGIEDEIIEKIMGEHGKNVQELQNLKNIKADLEEAQATIEKLKKDNKDNAELQKEVEAYKEKLEVAENERKEESKARAIEDALRNAKGKDLDYLKYKLGDLEVDKDGNLKDIDSKIKELKEKHPSFFEEENDNGAKNQNNAGYKPVGNTLDDGDSASKEETVANEFSKALGL